MIVIPELITKKILEEQDGKKKKKKKKEKAEKKRQRAEHKEDRTDLLSMLRMLGTVLKRILQLRSKYYPGFFMSLRASMPEALRNRNTGSYGTAGRGLFSAAFYLFCWLWFIFKVTMWLKWFGVIGFGVLWLKRLQNVYAETNLAKAIERADDDAIYGTFGM